MITVDTLLAAALRSRRSFATLRRAVTSDLAVPNPWQLDLMRFAADHVDQYGDVPREGDVMLWVESQPETRQESLRAAWRGLARQDLSSYTEDHLTDAAAETFREKAVATAVARLAALGNPTAAQFAEMSEQVKRIRPITIDGLAALEDVDAHMRVSRDEGRRVSTGIEKLDEVLGGGFEQELVFLLAGTGVGKTTFLVNRLVAATLHGSRCLHISLELSASKTLHRYYRRIADAHRGEFFDDYSGVEARVRHWLRLAGGSTHVLYLPAYGPTMDDIRTTVEMFAEMHGGIDVLALDYLDLLARSSTQRGLRTDEQLGILSHEIRTICTTMDAEVITASQANREGLTADKLTLKHMAGAIAKAQAADVVMGLVQNEDEARMCQARLGLLKMRDYPGKGVEIPCHYDMDKMMIMDLDDPSARLRRQRMEAAWPDANQE